MGSTRQESEQQARRRRTVEIIATFAMYMHGVETGDRTKAAQAKDRLAEFGISLEHLNEAAGLATRRATGGTTNAR